MLLVCHETLVPPAGVRGYTWEAPPDWRTEFDVAQALRRLGHSLRVVGAAHDIQVVLDACREFAPEVVFNLMVEFHADPALDQHVASLFELLELPYTGCNPRGLTLARDKVLSKEVLAARGVDVPAFHSYERGARFRVPRDLTFPLIVKSRTEEASLGLSRASIVTTPRALARRVAFVHERLETDAIAEEYLEGRELYSAVLESGRPRVLPTRELAFTRRASHPPIATRAVKFSPAAQLRLGVVSRAARLAPALERRVHAVARRTWEALGLSGYARVDLRLTPSGRLAVLEANPNPELADGEDFAEAAHRAGLGYTRLVGHLVELALR